MSLLPDDSDSDWSIEGDNQLELAKADNEEDDGGGQSALKERKPYPLAVKIDELSKENQELKKRMEALEISIKNSNKEVKATTYTQRISALLNPRMIWRRNKDPKEKAYKKLSEKEKDFLDDIVGEHPIEPNLNYMDLAVTHVSLKQMDHRFYHETLTMHDGTKVTTEWRPDGITRNGVRARFRDGQLWVHRDDKLLHRYKIKPYYIFMFAK